VAEIEVFYEGGFSTRCIDGETKKELVTDAPSVYGGKAEEWSPTDLLVAALGSCIFTIMGMSAKKLGVSIEGARMSIKKVMSATPPRKIAEIDIAIWMPSRYPPEVAEKLERSIEECPVHRSLHPEIRIKHIIEWGQQ